MRSGLPGACPLWALQARAMLGAGTRTCFLKSPLFCGRILSSQSARAPSKYVWTRALSASYCQMAAAPKAVPVNWATAGQPQPGPAARGRASAGSLPARRATHPYGEQQRPDEAAGRGAAGAGGRRRAEAAAGRCGARLSGGRLGGGGGGLLGSRPRPPEPPARLQQHRQPAGGHSGGAGSRDAPPHPQPVPSRPYLCARGPAARAQHHHAILGASPPAERFRGGRQPSCGRGRGNCLSPARPGGAAMLGGEAGRRGRHVGRGGVREGPPSAARGFD